MPPVEGINLGKFQPTAEEIVDARKLILHMNQKEKRATSGSLAHFLKANPTDDLGLGDRGPKRTELLEKFMVWQLRQKAANK